MTSMTLKKNVEYVGINPLIWEIVKDNFLILGEVDITSSSDKDLGFHNLTNNKSTWWFQPIWKIH